MRDDQRPQSPWARGARAAERQPSQSPRAGYPEYPERPARSVYPVADPVPPQLPWPEYPPGDQPEYQAEYLGSYQTEYPSDYPAEYPPEYPEYPADYPQGEYLPEPEPRWDGGGEAPAGRDRRRILVVVAAVAAVVGGGALVAVVLGGSSHPQRTRQVADSRQTAGGSAAMQVGAATPSATPSSPSASPTPSATAKPAATHAKPPAPAPLKFTAVTGPGCATSGTYSYSVDGDGWSVTTGTPGGNGCGVPAALITDTGDPSGADRVGWWYNPAFNRTATCTFSVYVPNTSKATAVKATYEVFHGSQSLGTFRVNQAASRGSWVTSPSFQTPDKIWVQLADRGPAGYSLAVGAMRVTCTA